MSILKLSDVLKEKGLKIATAESCTGGMIGAALTDFAGSSALFDRGFITYSNEAKIEMLGVDAQIITEHGAVSAQCAIAMAEGALASSQADIAVSVTGIAGPGGGSAEKPVGLVYIGVARKGLDAKAFEHHFRGDRADIRIETVKHAAKHAIAAL